MRVVKSILDSTYYLDCKIYILFDKYEKELSFPFYSKLGFYRNSSLKILTVSEFVYCPEISDKFISCNTFNLMISKCLYANTLYAGSVEFDADNKVKSATEIISYIKLYYQMLGMI